MNPNPPRKLTFFLAEEIRLAMKDSRVAHNSGLSAEKLAMHFSVSSTTIKSIISNKIYKTKIVPEKWWNTVTTTR